MISASSIPSIRWRPTGPGIFVSGGFQGPVDIPESVFSASGAGSQIGEFLDYRRGNLTRERIYPEERDVSAGGAEDRGLRVSLRGEYLRHRECSFYGRILQNLTQCRPRSEPAIFVRDQLCQRNHRYNEGKRTQPGGCRRVLPQDPGAALPGHASGGGNQPVLLRDGQYQGA